ncbi:urease accessory protein UreE [Mastigocoleus sp. MO_188.B34]|uniref:urease accessory protein UreE n=1 Tax=Mastigocoleus sp. MO_188.B34 TaxID=3036635 RepID=UPI0026181E9F|nr:urease accessory protein UreE [Mastigocoleus sp. MO_188.B34]MDJ0694659.1 urease accessory protein UreE [Mastigocoleus sp. MO_188.B34]
MLTFNQIQQSNSEAVINFTLSLSAEERTRSRHRFATEEGEIVCLRLPRGTVLQDSDILLDETKNYLAKIIAKPEEVITVYADRNIDLIKAAYHLGNRHVPLEITTNYLRLSPDPVLRKMLESFNLKIKKETVPFQPQKGAYEHQVWHAH